VRWGRGVEAGLLGAPWVEPPGEASAWTIAPRQASTAPQELELEFERGIPTALDGQRLQPLELILRLNELGGAHGVGRIDHVENRLVGIKSREVYEAPAAVILLTAHQELEKLTHTKEQTEFKALVAREMANLVYNGRWFSA